MEKIKVLGPKEHTKCDDHMLVLVTQANGTRYPMESCGKINFYLHLMKQKYGWKIDTISVYNDSNVKALLKQMEEEDARNEVKAAKAAEAASREVSAQES